MMKRRKLMWGLIAGTLYALLVVLLPVFERTDPGASILTLPQSLWYSLTTLTTVGYGDLVPVTGPGRIIGVIFQLLSLSVLAMLVGAFVPLIAGRLVPYVKLRLARRKEWFVFPDPTDAALTLARALYKEDVSRIIILTGDAGSADVPEDLGCIRSPLEPATLAEQKGDGRVSVFCMSGDGAENEALAHELENSPCQVYCMTEHEPDRTTDDRHGFDPYDCCARLYWRKFPLRAADEKVVLIGDGKYAQALLSFGLELNVNEPVMRTQYRIFGDWENFRRDHHRMGEFLALDREDPSEECLLFFPQPWNAHPQYLSEASRIVFCSDSEAETHSRLTELRRFFPVSCPVHARLSLPFDGVSTFGSLSELYAPELVLRAGLNDTAVRMHEIYRASVQGQAPDWKELSSFLRRSNIASAEHLRIKVGILLGADAVGEGPLTRELCRRAYAVFAAADQDQRERYQRIEHERWRRFHLMNNWAYAEKRDDAARLHPLLVPFDRLSKEDRLKNEYAWELLKEI